MTQKRFISEALKAHNELRSKHQTANLELDSTLCDEAKEWAEHLAQYETLNYRDGNYLNQPYGENILRVKLGQKYYFPGDEATNEWYQGSLDYKYNGIFDAAAGNFTQMVWKNSKKVGFGFAISERGYFYAVANYFPAGNIKNEFSQNVSPPEKHYGATPPEKKNGVTGLFEYFRLLGKFPSSSIPENKVAAKVPVKVSDNVSPVKNSLSGFDPVQAKFITEALDAHNKCRSKHGVSPLQHNNDLSVIAQNYAQKLAKLKTLKHSSKDSRMYKNEQLGENLAFAYDSTLNFYSGEKATMQWYDEIKDHNFNLDSQPGTGHFTQVIWKKSTDVGFGVAEANDGSFYAVANYYPAGNFLGKFVQNVPRPIN